MKLFIAIILSSILLLPFLAGAEYYKYIDDNGNVSFTDNIMAVPEDQRQNAQTIKEPKRYAEEHLYREDSKMLASPSLSPRDLEFIDKLKEAGVIDDRDLEAAGPEHIAEDIEHLRKMLKELYGIDENDMGKRDPRFSSPEETWAQHKEALMRGDIDAALECFIPKSAKQYGEIYRATSTSFLRKGTILGTLVLSVLCALSTNQELAGGRSVLSVLSLDSGKAEGAAR
jgi:Domain of unknown function (DUF4124)